MLVTTTYRPLTAKVFEITGDRGENFAATLMEAPWGVSGAERNSELWRSPSQGLRKLTVKLNQPSAQGFDVYVDEFAATTAAGWASPTGSEQTAGTVSLGSQSVATPPQIIFVHAEGQGTLSGGAGFNEIPRAGDAMEQWKFATAETQVTFGVSEPGPWMAFIVLLK